MAKIIALSAIDQFAVRCYINTLFCFPTQQSGALQTISSHLRKCLSTFSKDFPFLKGQVCPTSSRGYVEVSYDIDEPDPPFFAQTCSSLSYSELRASGFNIHSGCYDTFTLAPDMCGSAVFAIKVSFVDGGCIICISIHHSFSDGRGAFTISELFASYCKGEPEVFEIGGLSDRLQMLHGNLKITAQGDISAAPNAERINPISAPSERANTASLVSVIFLFTDQATRNLRATLFSRKGSPAPISRLDVITSLLFARIMKARSSILPYNTIVSLNTAVDARSRLDPPLSIAYLGNVVIGACLDICLANPTSEPNKEDIELQQISAIATTLRACIKAIDDTAMREYMSYLDSQPNIEQYFDDTHPAHPEASMMCSSWAAWPAHGLDFGIGLGKPEAVRSHTGDSGDLRVQPRSGAEGDWEVTAVLEQNVVEKLKRDRLLEQWCEISCLE